MKMSDIQGIAKERGVTPKRLAKVELVRSLQQAEGNAACFQTGQVDSCGQDGCLWRTACA